MGYEPHDGFRFWRRSIAPQTPTDFDVKPHVAVSSDGAVIAVAATSTHLRVSTFLTREYKADGSILWTARENGPNDSGEVTDVVASGFGNTSVNVYVVGQGTNTGGQEGAFLWRTGRWARHLRSRSWCRRRTSTMSHGSSTRGASETGSSSRPASAGTSAWTRTRSTDPFRRFTADRRPRDEWGGDRVGSAGDWTPA